MFDSNTPPPVPTGNRPLTDTVAQLGAPYTHVFLAKPEEGGLRIFQNGVELLATSIESLSIEITAPDDREEGLIAASLSRYTSPGSSTGASLFPGTVEVIGEGKRLVVSCSDPASFDGLFLRFGDAEGGIGLDANGVGRFRLVITPDLQDVRLQWAEDGREDVIALSPSL